MLEHSLVCNVIVFVGDVRNDLYVTLARGEFEKGPKTAGKNVEVRVMILDSEGTLIQVGALCISL